MVTCQYNLYELDTDGLTVLICSSLLYTSKPYKSTCKLHRSHTISCSLMESYWIGPYNYLENFLHHWQKICGTFFHSCSIKKADHYLIDLLFLAAEIKTDVSEQALELLVLTISSFLLEEFERNLFSSAPGRQWHGNLILANYFIFMWNHITK